MTVKPSIPTATTLASALTLLLASACMPAGDGGGGEGDGSGEGDGDAELGCAAAATYESIPAPTAEGGVDEDGQYYELYADLDTEPSNQLEVSLWTGYGVFADAAIAPGTYTISGDETSYELCGACAAIWADYDPVADEVRQELMAQSGTIVIDSIEGTMAGSLVDVVFQEVDPDTGEVVPDGCTTTISAPFSAAL